jgi:hypothetical protein
MGRYACRTVLAAALAAGLWAALPQSGRTGPQLPSLAGTWFCKKAWLVERQGSAGPTTLRLKPDGVYVFTIKNARDQIVKEYGKWEAPPPELKGRVKMVPTALQAGSGKLERYKNRREGSRDYALSEDGQTLTLSGSVFKRQKDASR